MSFNYTYNYPQVARDSGFKLRNYKDGPLDWRLMGSLEVERILRDQSLEQIDSVLSHLSEAPLGSILESNILDSGIAKYFILSQFSVQYLLFCRKFLEETVTDLRESHGVSQMELATLKRSLSEANNEILQLHKKITQIEAIHEVIYPCHLCTKNFVSNDALNLHISRKHSGFIVKPEKRSETHQVTVKERENDLTLINTIKLELEIKQLKERLNNAEREIKDRNPAASNILTSKDTSNCDKPEKHSVNSIGIQSNLSEIKETDDNSVDDLNDPSSNRQHWFMLQEKLQEFEQWKDEQKNQNSEFLIEIKNKLQNLTEAWEMAKHQSEQEFKNENLRSSPSSVEHLEVLLSKKVDDIGKASAAKLEEVVNKIETNYKKMFEEMEKEMKQINDKPKLQNESKNSDHIVILSSKVLSNDETFEIVESKGIKTQREQSKDLILNDRKSPIELECHQQGDTLAKNEKSISSSNHTFVKSNNIKNFAIGDEDQNNISVSDENDCTDISESLQDEEQEDISNSKNVKASSIVKEKSKTLRKPKVVTRKQAMKLTNSRLISLGVDMNATSLTHASMKRISEELNDKRNKLKLKHPQFYATRNKIKKFVDKLCSSKMPKNAEALLKITNNVNNRRKPFKSQGSEYATSSDDDDDDNEAIEASTPLNDAVSTHRTDFKQRLAQILASPIQKPDKHFTKAIIHHHQSNVVEKPVPMPRKRVMFNQAVTREKRLDESLSNTESNESIVSERYRKSHAIKTNLTTSKDSFL